MAMMRPGVAFWVAPLPHAPGIVSKRFDVEIRKAVMEIHNEPGWSGKSQIAVSASI
jgi:hypothetical protein